MWGSSTLHVPFDDTTARRGVVDDNSPVGYRVSVRGHTRLRTWRLHVRRVGFSGRLRVLKGLEDQHKERCMHAGMANVFPVRDARVGKLVRAHTHAVCVFHWPRQFNRLSGVCTWVRGPVLRPATHTENSRPRRHDKLPVTTTGAHTPQRRQQERQTSDMQRRRYNPDVSK